MKKREEKRNWPQNGRGTNAVRSLTTSLRVGRPSPGRAESVHAEMPAGVKGSEDNLCVWEPSRLSYLPSRRRGTEILTSQAPAGDPSAAVAASLCRIREILRLA